MHKKLLCGILLGTMCLSLAACSDKVDDKTVIESDDVVISEDVSNDLAKELIDSIDVSAHSDSVTDAIITMNAGMSMKYDDEVMKFSMIGDINVKCNNDVSHMSGTMVVEGMDNKEEQIMESWTSYDENGNRYIYELNQDDNKWYKSYTTSNAYSNDYVSSLTSDIFSKLGVKETDSEYIVIGYALPNDIDDSISETFGESMSGVDNSKYVKVTVIFDKLSKEYKSVEFDFSDVMQGMNGMDVDTFIMKVTINGYLDENLSVPSDIISSAISSSTLNNSEYSTSTDSELSDNEVYNNTSDRDVEPETVEK